MTYTRHDEITSQLCAEIDLLRADRDYYKAQSEHWRQEHGKLVVGQINSSQELMGNILTLTLMGRLK